MSASNSQAHPPVTDIAEAKPYHHQSQSSEPASPEAAEDCSPDLSQPENSTQRQPWRKILEEIGEEDEEIRED